LIKYLYQSNYNKKNIIQ